MIGLWNLKEKSDKTLKARWCAQGFIESFAENTYADVLHPTTMRMLFAFAASNDLFIRQIDITTAFLHVELYNLLYIEQSHCRVRTQI